jgi:hypothetical protein
MCNERLDPIDMHNVVTEIGRFGDDAASMLSGYPPQVCYSQPVGALYGARKPMASISCTLPSAPIL